MSQIEVSVDKVCNPRQLEAEIRAIPGFPQQGLSVYGRPNQFGYVIYAGTLSLALRQAALQVINNHVPDFTEDNERQELQDDLDFLRDNYALFDNLSDSQKFAAIKRAIRALLLKAKYN